MKEKSTFTVYFDFNFPSLPDIDLPDVDSWFQKLKKRINELSKLFPDPTGALSKSTIADVPDLENVAQVVVAEAGKRAVVEMLKRSLSLVGGMILEQILEEYGDDIVDILFKRPPTDLDRLKKIETNVIESRRQARIALEDVETFGERPNSLDKNGLLLDKEFLEERIKLLNELLEKITNVRDELEHGKLQSGPVKPPDPVTVPIVPRIPVPIGNITIDRPQLDRLEEIKDEYKEIIEEGNKIIEERSQLLPTLENALAMTGDASLIFAGNQDIMSDATNGVIASVLQLRKEGLDPLPRKTKESDKAIVDLVSSLEAGALVGGYTKEELLGVGLAAGEAAEKTKDLDKNALKGVTDQAGKAEETLGTLNSTTGDLSARSKELADEQEHVTQAVADGSAVMDNAGASAEQFGEALAQVESSGGFFDGIKQGFIDFVENVESNSELMADFFANTLTEMSQNFSDLFYNVLTGKFDNLQDLAKQAFEAILRAFLDMVAAIATRQIVISIAGAIGIGTKGASATDYLGLGKQAVGLGGDLAGMFSGGAGGAALGGSAALGGGISAIGAGAGAAGGATSVGASLGLSGISSVGTVPTGGAEEMEYQMAA